VPRKKPEKTGQGRNWAEKAKIEPYEKPDAGRQMAWTTWIVLRTQGTRSPIQQDLLRTQGEEDLISNNGSGEHGLTLELDQLNHHIGHRVILVAQYDRCELHSRTSSIEPSQITSKMVARSTSHYGHNPQASWSAKTGMRLDTGN
jgi:hypothetical protein